MSGSSGVRSLLAKFENNNVSNSSTSPPSRGRSPAAAGSDPSGNSRPLSKVRASFVAVERSTQGQTGSPLVGLRKTNGLDSPMGSRPASAIGSPIERTTTRSPTDSWERGLYDRNAATSPQSQPSLNEVMSPRSANGGISPAGSPVPDNKMGLTGGSPIGNKEGLGTILKGSPFEEASSAATPADKSPEIKAKANKVQPENGLDVPVKTKTSETPAIVETKVEATPTTRPSDIVVAKNGNRSTAKPQPAAPKSPPATSARTPRTPRTPSSRTASKGPAARSPAVAKDARHAQSRTTATKPTRAAAPNAGTKPAVSKPRGTSLEPSRKASSQSSPERARARARSPTRPVRLPGSMTAPTTASAAKLGAENAPRAPSRSGVNTTKLNRKPSSVKPERTTVASKPPSSATTAVRKQISRASLANQTQDRPKSRTGNASTRAPDESFLARMMRPTASSANKVQDKDVKSPPRASKSATRAQTQRKTPSRTQSLSPSRAKSAQASQTNGSPQQDSNTKATPPPDNVSIPEEPEESEEPQQPTVQETPSADLPAETIKVEEA